MTGVASFRVYKRPTDAANWVAPDEIIVKTCETATACKKDNDATQAVLPHVRVDDWVFGVSSVSKDGFESPVASAVPGGAFKPYVAPEKK
jgi:hypothetical protein